MGTRQLQQQELEGLVGRFNQQKTVRERAQGMGVPFPDFVFDLLISRDLYTLVGNTAEPAPYLKPALQGPRGFSMVISKVEPGEGPGLHTHKSTTEIFVVLDGKFSIQCGDKGEHAVVLERFDSIVVPPDLMRRYQNVSDQTAHLLAIVTGGEDNLSELDYVPGVGQQIESKGSPQLRKALEGIGVRFTAGT
ncbi:cupin domain-containing protein [Corallococcus llansteffanensis]|uniref:Cupin domain-containing protein n=1 Tax=Corallococcus llansteffanensis TaxID=2316731 RepID=A0A3A8N5D8_9BACT|nr:cupin domain-containing protein [Corallococcus llansteffanensis]RKH37481.1 cupin domain-containing protein [Corallococcus llansteffanensis]